jgi:hypothetical protein
MHSKRNSLALVLDLRFSIGLNVACIISGNPKRGKQRGDFHFQRGEFRRGDFKSGDIQRGDFGDFQRGGLSERGFRRSDYQRGDFHFRREEFNKKSIALVWSR